MTNFRVKNFSLGTGLAVATLGVGTANLAAGLHRNRQLDRQAKQQRKLGEQQLQAMNKLNESLGSVNDSMKNFRIPQVNNATEQAKKRKKKKRSFFSKTFSIQGGGFRKTEVPRVNPENTKDILSAQKSFSGWLISKANESLFNSGNTRETNSFNIVQILNSEFSDKDFEVNGDPRGSVISLAYSGSAMVLYINNPTPNQLESLNECLDSYCEKYSNADYSAEQLRDNIYISEIFIVEGTEEDLISSLVDSYNLKLNIITKI